MSENATIRAPANVLAYLDAVGQLRTLGGERLTSVVVFGSAARGGFSTGSSDVDLIAVLPDDATGPDIRRVREAIARLEREHGLETTPARALNLLERFAERAGNGRATFVCTRSDMLSGDIARVLALRPVEARLVDGIVFASILASAVTVLGEDLLPLVPPIRVRRADVFVAWHAFTAQVLLCIIAYAVMPDATKYAMGALKRSLHSCFFYLERRAAPLDEEVAYFDRWLGPSRARTRLLELRRRYGPSFIFVVRCVASIARLHLATASRRIGHESRIS